MSNKFTSYNHTANDQLQEPMFLGNPMNIARYDQQRHPIFEKLTERQISLFWMPTEVSVTKDKMDFQKMEKHEKHIFTSNLRYQILLDSVQTRCPSIILMSICSLPEVESFLSAFGFFESVHSRSYTHIIRNVYDDPSEVFDDIVENANIVKRAESVTKYYDDLEEAITLWRRGELSKREVKKKLVLCMAAVNALEGIRFFVSFACTFSFAERKTMEASAKIVKLVCRDEAVHLAFTTHVMKLWESGRDDPEMVEIMTELKPEIRSILLTAGEEEKEWAEYLFKDGSTIGLNYTIIAAYVEHITDKRLMALGHEPEFGGKKSNLPWMQSWESSAGVQIMPQETEITAYLTGSIDSSLTDNEFEGMEL